MIRTDTLAEMFDVAMLLASQPPPVGNHVGIVTNAGGLGFLCADTCEANGLVLPHLSQETVEELHAFLPSEASTGNPVDMIASATGRGLRASRARRRERSGCRHRDRDLHPSSRTACRGCCPRDRTGYRQARARHAGSHELHVRGTGPRRPREWARMVPLVRVPGAGGHRGRAGRRARTMARPRPWHRASLHGSPVR